MVEAFEGSRGVKRVVSKATITVWRSAEPNVGMALVMVISKAASMTVMGLLGAVVVE